MRDIDLEYYEGLLREIGEIVHTPTKKTHHRTAQDHFQADFDAIRKIVAIGLKRFTEKRQSTEPKTATINYSSRIRLRLKSKIGDQVFCRDLKSMA